MGSFGAGCGLSGLWPSLGEAAIHSAMRGQLQKAGEVIHLNSDRITKEDDMLRSIGRSKFAMPSGRGDGARHHSGPDPRDPDVRRGRTLSYPNFAPVHESAAKWDAILRKFTFSTE